MKRRVPALLTAALCLLLAACAQSAPVSPGPDAPSVPAQAPAAPDTPAAPEAPAEPLRLDALNVEFAVAGHDENALLTLQKSFPAVLTDALKAQNVEVGSVRVTFGTSGEATQTAMLGGAVQLAFLSAGDYFPYRGGMVVALEDGVDAALEQGLLVMAASDDESADERLASALRDALAALAPALAPYTGPDANGLYRFDAARLEELGRLYEESIEAPGAP